jgi:hypothetical protein
VGGAKKGGAGENMVTDLVVSYEFCVDSGRLGRVQFTEEECHKCGWKQK